MQKIINKILKNEEKYNLFKNKFKNYAIWPYYRMYFYYTISKDLEILNSSVSGFKKDLKYMKKIMNIFNFKLLFEKKDVLILEHPRSNKNKIDIYTYDIAKYIGNDKCSFFAFSNNGLINKQKRVVILDLLKIFSKIYSKMVYNFIKIDTNFQNFLNEFTMVEKQKYIQQYRRYQVELKFQYYFYYLLLKIKQVKKVVLTVAYYNIPLIYAAKNLNIEVIEMQHGVVSKYHLGYHYPYYETEFFPDKLFTFSKFWNNSAIYPKSYVMNVGNNFLYTIQEDIVKEKNTILIISQTTIGKKLEKFILKNIMHLQDYKIYFKLHPNEFNNYEKNYKEFLKYKNIFIISTQYTIHELQNFCEYQIGIYSTAIYEGIERKCKTLLLNDTGIEYMEQVLKEGFATLIEYNNHLKDKLLDVDIPKNIVFFDKFQLESL